MRLPLLISASACQDVATIHLFEANWKLSCDNDTAEFLVSKEYDGCVLTHKNGDEFRGPCNIKVTSLTTNKPCSIYAELVRATTGSS